VGKRQCLRINLPPSYDANLSYSQVSGLLLSKCNRLFERTNRTRTVSLKSLVSCDHDIGSPRQRMTNRFPGPPSHNYGLTNCQGLETPEIGRKPPRHVIITPDDTIFGGSNNDRNNRLVCRHGEPQT